MLKGFKFKLQRFFFLLNRIRLPGFGGVGLYDVLRFFVNALSDSHFTIRAMAMAYRFFFALFPALVLIFTVVPQLPIPDLESQMAGFFKSIFPSNSMGMIEMILTQFFSKPGVGLISLNIALVAFSSLGGIKVMMAAFDRKDEFFQRRNIFRTNGVALLIFVLLIVLFLVMLSAMILGDYLVAQLHSSEDAAYWLLLSVKWLIIFLALQLTISILYFLGPSMTSRFNFISPGSMLAGLLMLLAIVVFRLFFARFANYNKIYGSLSAVMVMMVWFYWLSIVLLIGFELNRAIAKAKLKHRRSLEGPISLSDVGDDDEKEAEKGWGADNDKLHTLKDR
jgi:membrane protein